ncbi:MAG: thiamine pyrophosphate-dependent enzyme, partial [Pseudomonadota bacterium]
TSFLFAQNAAFIANLFRQYEKDPSNIDPSWRTFFATMGDEARSVLGELDGASWSNGHDYLADIDDSVAEGFLLEVPPEQPVVDPSMEHGRASAKIMPGASEEDLRRATLDSIQAIMMIRAYRVRGHMLAELDPLSLEEIEEHPELDPASYGFTDEDYDRPIFINNVLGLYTATLREIIERLRATYCGAIGVEYSHIQDPDEKSWIQGRIEAIHNRTDFTQRGREAIYERLAATETFEHYLNVKHTGTKRFGLDGGEALVPALEQILKRGSQLGLEEVVIGMAHRGRLNVLANVMQKPFSAIFSEFQGTPANPDEVQGSGDVKYHLGTSTDREFDGKTVHLSLTANPSHLEAVNPVVVGKVRAKQIQHNDAERTKVMGLLLHGDAAFAGQGIVSETFMLSELKGYRTGGTLHFIINNQIGFTTSPSFARPGRYPTDIALALQAPIFHVNGDDPEAVVHASRIAIEYRQKFKKDVVVDMFCYRRHGHNEGDEPAFTQPIMYRKIAGHPTTRQIHGERMVREGVLQPGQPEEIVENFRKHLDEEFAAATSYK